MDTEQKWLLKEKYNGEKSEAFLADCKRLALGEPLAYLIGHAPFLDSTIFLDGRPLIPRPETEYWVEQAIEVIKRDTAQTDLFSVDQLSAEEKHPQRKSPERGPAESQPTTGRRSPYILDLCAGSGCIGVAVAARVPEARVDFSEIDARLLATIKKNCHENNLPSEQYTVHQSNLFEQLPQDRLYDFILTNPPYIDPAVDRAEESVKVHEPHLALYGGEAGVEIIAAIIAEAPKHLRRGGQLWIEHEPEQAAFIQTHGAEHSFAVSNHKDQYEVIRYSILVLQ